MSESGTKYDTGKPEWNLLPMQQVEEIVQVLTHGRHKYGADNWQQVEHAHERYYAAALRHLTAWQQSRTQRDHNLAFDSESDLNHLAHAAACLIFLLWFDRQEMCGGPEDALGTDGTQEEIDALKKYINMLAETNRHLSDSNRELYGTQEEIEMLKKQLETTQEALRNMCDINRELVAEQEFNLERGEPIRFAANTTGEVDVPRARRKALQAIKKGKKSFKLDGVTFVRKV